MIINFVASYSPKAYLKNHLRVSCAFRAVKQRDYILQLPIAITHGQILVVLLEGRGVVLLGAAQLQIRRT